MNVNSLYRELADLTSGTLLPSELVSMEGMSSLSRLSTNEFLPATNSCFTEYSEQSLAAGGTNFMPIHYGTQQGMPLPVQSSFPRLADIDTRDFATVNADPTYDRYVLRCLPPDGQLRAMPATQLEPREEEYCTLDAFAPYSGINSTKRCTTQIAVGPNTVARQCNDWVDSGEQPKFQMKTPETQSYAFGEDALQGAAESNKTSEEINGTAEAARKRERLLRNRASVRKCRAKKKKREVRLELEHEELGAENEKMKKLLESLKSGVVFDI